MCYLLNSLINSDTRCIVRIKMKSPLAPIITNIAILYTLIVIGIGIATSGVVVGVISFIGMNKLDNLSPINNTCIPCFNGSKGDTGDNATCSPDACNSTDATFLNGVPICDSQPLENQFMGFTGECWGGSFVSGSGNVTCKCVNGTNGINGTNGSDGANASCNGLCTSTNATSLFGYEICSVPPLQGQFLQWNQTCWLPLDMPPSINDTNSVSLRGYPICASINPVEGDILEWTVSCWNSSSLPIFENQTNSVSLQGYTICTDQPISGEFLNWNGTCWGGLDLSPFINYTNSVSLQGFSISPVTPIDDQFLGWGGSSWIPKDLPVFDNATNSVALMGYPICNNILPSNGQFLEWETSCWNSSSLPVFDNQTNSVALQNIPISPITPNYNSVLTYNGFVWIPQAIPGVNNSCLQPCQNGINGTNGVNGLNASCNGLCTSTNATSLLGYQLCYSTPLSGQFMQWNGTCWGPFDLATFINETNAVAIQNIPVSPIVPISGQYFGYDGTVWIATSFPNFINETNAVAIQYTSVSPIAPTSGQFLGYDGLVWIPTSLPNFINETNAVSIQNVPVSQITPVSGQYFGYNGVTWIATSLPNFINETNAVSIQYTPVSSIAPTSGQYLGYNGLTWIPTSFPNFVNETNAVSIQYIPVSSTLPISGQLLGYNGLVWIPTSLPNFVNETNAVSIQFIPVSSITPISGQFLGYNGLVWIPASLPNFVNETNAVSIQNVPVSILSPISGQFLGYNGITWIPTTVATAINETNAVSIQGISVSSTAPLLNQVFQYNGVSWLPQYLYPLTSASFTIYVNKGGNDATADGTPNRPYLTLTAAMADVGTSSSALPWQIDIGPGIFTETLISLRNGVWIKGVSPVSTVIQAATMNLNISFSASGYSGLSELSITSSTPNFNFQTVGGTATRTVYLRNVFFEDGLIFKGFTATDTLDMIDCELFTGTNTLEVHGGVSYITSSAIFGNVLVDDQGGQAGSSTVSRFLGCELLGGGFTFNQYRVLDSSTLNIFSTYSLSVITLNGTSTASLNLDADSYPNLPITNPNGVVITRLTDAPAIGYTPTNSSLWTTGVPTTVQQGLDTLISATSPAFALPAATQTIYVSKGGSDSTGNGTPSKPYLSISAGLAAVGTASSAIPWEVNVGPGLFVESVISMKLGVWIKGVGPGDTIIQVTTMNISNTFSSASGLTGMSGVELTSSIPNFNFQSLGSATRSIYFQNVFFESGMIFRGFTGTDTLDMVACEFYSAGNALEIHGGTSYITSSFFFGAVLIDDLGGQAGSSTTARFIGSALITGAFTLTQYRTSDNTALSLFSTRSSSAIIMNGTSTQSINIDADSYPNFSITNPNGAIVTRLTYSPAIGYTPTTSSNWYSTAIPTTVQAALDSLAGPTFSNSATMISSGTGGSSSFSATTTVSGYRLNNQVFIKILAFSAVTGATNTVPSIVCSSTCIPVGFQPSTGRNKFVLTTEGGTGAVGQMRINGGIITVFQNVLDTAWSVSSTAGTDFDEGMKYNLYIK